jgi:hypothetical protein
MREALVRGERLFRRTARRCGRRGVTTSFAHFRLHSGRHVFVGGLGGTMLVPGSKGAILTCTPRDNPRIEPLFPQGRQTPASDRR